MKKIIVLAITLGSVHASDITQAADLPGQIMQQQKIMLQENQKLAQDKREFDAILKELKNVKNGDNRTILETQKKEIAERQKVQQQKVRAEIEKMNQLNQQAKKKDESTQSYTQIFIQKIKSGFNWVKSMIVNPFA